MNLTLGITRETASEYGVDVQFMTEYIYTVINGNADAYNSLFSDEYFKNNKPKEKFTMQKLYEVNISKVSAETQTDSNGRNYTKYKYIIEYSILDNNGTFRNDFNTGKKAQYIFLSNKAGRILIDDISTPQIKK